MNKRGVEIIIAASIASVLLCCGDYGKNQIKRVMQEYRGRYALYVSKKTFSLYVYNRDCRVISKYKIAYGLNPDKKSKLFSGDNRTPEGVYRITEVLSMDADKKSKGYLKLRAMNRIYFRARDGHFRFGSPEQDIGDNVYGPRFFRISYPNRNDKARYVEALKRRTVPLKNGRAVPVGSGIAIHGNSDPASIGNLASSGCIRMYNNDIVELSNYVQLGMPIIISAE